MTSGFFPQSHTYTNHTLDYVVSVTAFYSGGTTGFAQSVVWFAPPHLRPVALPQDTAVSVATSPQRLLSRQQGYGFSEQLTNFTGTNFGVVPQATIEYVLTAAATMERDFANEDFVRPDGKFGQVVMRDQGGGFYSIWYSTPVAFAAGSTLCGSVPWSSCFHEMGHNITLNSPASYWYGGKIDGNANAIVSETLAQIFQHAAAYELVNHGAELGFSRELVADIRNSALSSMAVVASAYRDYTNQGSVFQSWNNPSTPQDETFDTFMTLAFEFFFHAEQDGRGYRVPLKRLMQAMQLFDSDWLSSYDPAEDTPAADSFRATLWVTALSHAFQTDLRHEFATLGFPVSDTAYQGLSARMAALPDIIHLPHRVGIELPSEDFVRLSINGLIPRFYSVEEATHLSAPDWALVANLLAIDTNSMVMEISATNRARFYRSILLQ